MTTNKTIKWLDIIDDVAAGYNSTPHRSIGMAPERVTYEDTEKIFKKLYPDIDLVVEPKLKKGNIVRILRKKSLFDKGYKQNWSTDVYKIKSHKQKAGVVWYKLVSLGGKEVSGSHYLYELRKIADDFESYNSKKF
ncbi:Oidioi.mRNA.OKI2018_I69.YSR.g17159.t1.cds [Oikopleura dioica]|uniref:Oidioi.mRNA.OKI2018_I69.YSR.g17159.t1.cds n=1 Tax=Oikopleura dioica TaxID=34765 RepID=A0ABN7SSN4_OIKDI|nr:Oidioi.mRNA.OKI2018_I69.YSR.g17159.t1.cds [Oikopleura dioica]